MGKDGANDLGQRLLNLKNGLEEAKSKRSELQGQLNGLMQRLEEGFNLQSLETAQKEMKGLEKQLESLQNKLDEEIENAEEAFENGS